MAEAEYQQAADIDPLALPAWEGLASAQMTEGRYAEGVEAYGRLVSRSQGHLSSSRSRGCILAAYTLQFSECSCEAATCEFPGLQYLLQACH